MNGVMMPSVSAGSSHLEASVMCTPQVRVPSGDASAGEVTAATRARTKTATRTPGRSCLIENLLEPDSRFAILACLTYVSRPEAMRMRELPPDVYPESLSRLPLLRREELDEDGKRYYDAVTGPNSRTLAGLQGPSGIWLHSPRLAEHLRRANQYLRYETGLDRRLTELAILVTARELDHQFEWTAHEPAALKEGLQPEIIDLVKHRKPISGRLPGMGDSEKIIVLLGRELFRDRKVRPATFARAVELFGRRGVLDLVALMGNYAMTALILTTFEQQVHLDKEPLLPMA